MQNKKAKTAIWDLAGAETPLAFPLDVLNYLYYYSYTITVLIKRWPTKLSLQLQQAL